MRSAALALTIVAACSSDSSGSMMTRCLAPMGSYRVCTYLNGPGEPCGSPPPCVVMDFPQPGGSCDDVGALSADQCTGTINVTCTGTNATTGQPFTVHVEGTSHANDTIGASWTAETTATFTDANGAVTCSGPFRLEYKRQ
jgi:hypothetical protein